MNIVDLATEKVQILIKGVADSVKTAVDAINTNIGNPTSSSSNLTSANAHAKLNYLLANGSAIKSFQRGVVTFESIMSSSGITKKTVSISSVNTSKCLLYINIGFTDKIMFPNVTNEITNSTTLTFTTPNIATDMPRIVNWYLVEFN